MEDRPGLFLDRSVWIVTVALGAMPLLGMRPMVLVIAIWLALLLAVRILERSSFRPCWKAWVVLSALFLLMLIDLPRAGIFNDGWRIAERSAALVIFPIGFLLLGAPASDLVRYRSFDLFAVTGATLAVVANVLMVPYLKDAWEVDATFSATYRNAFWEITGVHPPYAAYWFLGGSLFQLHLLLRSRSKLPKINALTIARWAIILTLLSTSLLIGSRMPLIAFVAAMGVLLFMHLRKRQAVRWMIASVLLVMLGALFMPGISGRIPELSSLMLENVPTQDMNSVQIRTPIAHCSLSLLEDRWIFGMGGTQLQPALDACYADLDLPTMTNGSYGPHCQPLQAWLAYGVSGLGAFLLLFGWSFRNAWRRSDAVHLAFLVFMLLCCLTEDLLTRQWGVVFFACFNTMFVASGLDRTDRRLPT